jgi:hypothetical protein
MRGLPDDGTYDLPKHSGDLPASDFGAHRDGYINQ